jgi:hypothetical protein
MGLFNKDKDTVPAGSQPVTGAQYGAPAGAAGAHVPPQSVHSQQSPVYGQPGGNQTYGHQDTTLVHQQQDPAYNQQAGHSSGGLSGLLHKDKSPTHTTGTYPAGTSFVRRVSCLTSRAGTTGTYGNTTTGHQDPALYNNQPGSAGHSSGGLSGLLHKDKHQDATYPAGKPSCVGRRAV